MYLPCLPVSFKPHAPEISWSKSAVTAALMTVVMMMMMMTTLLRWGMYPSNQSSQWSVVRLSARGYWTEYCFCDTSQWSSELRWTMYHYIPSTQCCNCCNYNQQTSDQHKRCLHTSSDIQSMYPYSVKKIHTYLQELFFFSFKISPHTWPKLYL